MRSSLEHFVKQFAHEFIAELSYLEKLARGDIPARAKDEPWDKIFNITQALLSVAPIPGLPLGFMMSRELIAKCVEYGQKAWQAAQQVQKGVVAARGKAKEFLDALDLAQSLLKEPKDQKGLLQDDKQGPIDHEAMRIFAELLARGLAQRFEHILVNYLDADNPGKDVIELAQTAVRRCFQYLQDNSFLDAKQIEPLIFQRNRLLNSISTGSTEKSWREQLTGHAAKFMPDRLRQVGKKRISVRAEFKSDAILDRVGARNIFTAEEFYTHPAWFFDGVDSPCYESQAHRPTWLELKKPELQNPILYPKYGYAYLESSDPKNGPFLDLKSVTVEFRKTIRIPSSASRFFQPVDKDMIRAYLNSDEVKRAKENKQTPKLTFHEFLHNRYRFPKHCQAICHLPLTDLDLSFGNFSRVDFSGAIFIGDLSGCCFDDAYLVGITLKDITCTKPISFANANLAFAKMDRARLPGIVLNQAILSFANLQNATLTGFKATGAQWYKTDLREIKEEGILDIQAQQREQVDIVHKRMQELEDQIKNIEDQIVQELLPLKAGLEKLDQAIQASKDKQKEELEQQKEELLKVIAEQANREWVRQYLEEQLEKFQNPLDRNEKAVLALQADIDEILKEKKQVQGQLMDLSNVVAKLVAKVAKLDVDQEHRDQIRELEAGQLIEGIDEKTRHLQDQLNNLKRLRAGCFKQKELVQLLKVVRAPVVKIEKPLIDEVLRLLVKQNDLIIACEQGDLSKVKAAIKDKARPDLPDAKGKQPLGAALWGMDPAVVDFLLEQKWLTRPMNWDECIQHNQKYYKEEAKKLNEKGFPKQNIQYGPTFFLEIYDIKNGNEHYDFMSKIQELMFIREKWLSCYRVAWHNIIPGAKEITWEQLRQKSISEAQHQAHHGNIFAGRVGVTRMDYKDRKDVPKMKNDLTASRNRIKRSIQKKAAEIVEVGQQQKVPPAEGPIDREGHGLGEAKLFDQEKLIDIEITQLDEQIALAEKVVAPPGIGNIAAAPKPAFALLEIKAKPTNPTVVAFQKKLVDLLTLETGGYSFTAKRLAPDTLKLQFTARSIITGAEDEKGATIEVQKQLQSLRTYFDQAVKSLAIVCKATPNWDDRYLTIKAEQEVLDQIIQILKEIGVGYFNPVGQAQYALFHKVKPAPARGEKEVDEGVSCILQ